MQRPGPQRAAANPPPPPHTPSPPHAVSQRCWGCCCCLGCLGAAHCAAATFASFKWIMRTHKQSQRGSGGNGGGVVVGREWILPPSLTICWAAAAAAVCVSNSFRSLWLAKKKIPFCTFSLSLHSSSRWLRTPPHHLSCLLSCFFFFFCCCFVFIGLEKSINGQRPPHSTQFN